MQIKSVTIEDRHGAVEIRRVQAHVEFFSQGRCFATVDEVDEHETNGERFAVAEKVALRLYGPRGWTNSMLHDVANLIEQVGGW
jgi:hypothetical protein